MTAPSSIAATAPSGPTVPPGDERIDPRLWRMAFVLIFGAILSLLDATIVNVGLDSVSRDLRSPLATIQWISTGYLLAVSLVMPLSGWAAERFGSKRVWMSAVALFVVGSLCCGLAWSAASLIAFRVLQGVGGALMQPVGQAFLAQKAGPARMGRMMGAISLPVMFAPALGPLLGGWIVQDLDWRWMFLVNLPVGVATLVAAARILPRDEISGATGASGATRLDLRGLALLSPGLGGVVFGFAQAAQGGGFGSWTVLLPLLAGAALLLGYGRHALRARIVPLIDLRLFARRGFAVATASSFLIGASLYSSMLLVPLYYQQIQHADVFRTGLLAVPQALGSALVMVFNNRLSARFGPRGMMLGGITLAMLGTVAFTQLGAGPAGWLLTGSLVLRGVGIGATMAPGMAAVFSSVEREQAPRAASALNVLNRVGGSLGTALLVVVLSDGLRQHGTTPAAAFGHSFWWVLGLTAVSLVPAALFPGRAKRS